MNPGFRDEEDARKLEEKEGSGMREGSMKLQQQEPTGDEGGRR